jgi:GT2 family glycosyltransferase
MKILSILITYNSEKWIKKNLTSIGQEVDILILDNGSTDNTVQIISEEFSHVRLIQNQSNLGFAAANNIGFEIAKKKGYDWVFLVNHDAWLAEDCIVEMKKVMRNSAYNDYGIFSPVHFSGDTKSYDFGFVRFCNILKLGAYQQQKKSLLDVKEVNGAFMMISLKCLLAVKGFDPLFFFYGEDIDLCYRAFKRNYKIGVVTNAFAYHDRKDRKEDFQRKKNRIIANHLIQFKQIKGGFINSYFKTLYSAARGFWKTPEHRACLIEVIKYFVGNNKKLKISYANYQ